MIVDENTREYLKMLQAIITRLNTNSFQIKTIVVTIVTSFIVFMYEKNQSRMVTIGIIVIIVLFWILDASFLRYEKAFREKYNEVVNKHNDDNLKKEYRVYDLEIKDKIEDIDFIKIMRLQSLEIIYLSLILIVFISAVVKY